MTSNVTLSSDDVSPVTLSADLSRVARLLLLASLAAIGSIGNVFMISAVMIEDYLRKRGNAFIVNIALADFLVSGLVIPASAIVILAGHKEHLTVCRCQWFLAALCFIVTVLSLTATAVENYTRLCNTSPNYNLLNRPRLILIVLVIWTLATITSALQFTTEWSFDYCLHTKRNTRRIPPHQAIITTLLIFLPILITIFCYSRATYVCHVIRHTMTTSSSGRQVLKPAAINFAVDSALMRTNLCGFILFLLFWTPFLVVLILDSFKVSITSSVYYNLAWLAISKSCVNSIIYGIINRFFRGAYVNLFHYCFCKTTVSFSRRQRIPDGPSCSSSAGGSSAPLRPSGDVRVHIIPGYNMYCSPQRATGGGLGGGGGGGGMGGMGQSKRSNGGRGVYEL